MSEAPSTAAVRPPNPPAVPTIAEIARRHLRFGWWTLLIFLSIGIVLEAFHAFKLPWYLDVGKETRRLMFTLAHSHGTLLALINIALGCTLLTLQPTGSWKNASRFLTWASLLMPGGFLLGGIVIFEGDPGIGIVLLPIGAIFLVIAVFLAARNISRST